jgi:hypothetical protein
MHLNLTSNQFLINGRVYEDNPIAIIPALDSTQIGGLRNTIEMKPILVTLSEWQLAYMAKKVRCTNTIFSTNLQIHILMVVAHFLNRTPLFD